MEVKVAKTAGFCFGVKRAVEKAYEVAEQRQGEVYTYGPIIHNEEVVADLSLIHISMAARVSQKVGAEADPTNFLLMHAMGPNVAGVIGTAVAAGTLDVYKRQVKRGWGSLFCKPYARCRVLQTAYGKGIELPGV